MLNLVNVYERDGWNGGQDFGLQQYTLTEEVRDQAPFLSTNYSNIIGEHLVFGFEKMESVSRNYLSCADLHYFKKRKYRDMIRNLKVR